MLIIVDLGGLTFSAETWSECLAWLESHEYGFTS